MTGDAVNTVVTIKDTSGNWLKGKESLADKALDAMAKSILAAARLRAPMSENGGGLRDSGRIEKSKNSVSVIYGGKGVPYGAYQERGHRRDGSHQVRRYTTPNTGARFLKDAGERNTKKGIVWLLSRA